MTHDCNNDISFPPLQKKSPHDSDDEGNAIFEAPDPPWDPSKAERPPVDTVEGAADAGGNIDVKGITKEAFERAIVLLSTLAVDGVKGTLHSVRSLRNRALQKTAPADTLWKKAVPLTPEEHRDATVERTADKLGGTLRDDMRVILLSLTGVGMPVALAQPMWLRLRRSALLCELYGHDARERKGEIIGAAFAVYSAGAPVENAVSLLWKMYCRNGVMKFLPVGAIVSGLVDTQGKAEAYVVDCFRPESRLFAREEWDGVPLEKVSLGRAVGAVGGFAATQVDRGMKAAQKKTSKKASKVATAVAEKSGDLAIRGVVRARLAASRVKGKMSERIGHIHENRGHQ